MPFLVQGTLYSDVIESGGEAGVAARIKSHHNVGGLPDDMAMELVEPLRQLFKDEARRVGEELGLPEPMVWRHPFPGPGSPCASSARSRASGSDAPRGGCHPARGGPPGGALSRALAVLLRAPRDSLRRCPGRRADVRLSIVIRAVTSDDAMTADWARLPYDLLEVVSGRIVNEIPAVNRVVLDITSKPPATIEWE